MISREDILYYLKLKKDFLKNKYGIINIGLYGSFSRGEQTENSDIDLFYDIDDSFSMGFIEFSNLLESLEKDLDFRKIDFVNLKSINPIIKYYAEKDFIYV